MLQAPFRELTLKRRSYKIMVSYRDVIRVGLANRGCVWTALFRIALHMSYGEIARKGVLNIVSLTIFSACVTGHSWFLAPWPKKKGQKRNSDVHNVNRQDIDWQPPNKRTGAALVS